MPEFVRTDTIGYFRGLRTGRCFRGEPLCRTFSLTFSHLACPSQSKDGLLLQLWNPAP